MQAPTLTRHDVLVCEDDPATAHFVRAILESCGAACDVVENGEAAIDAAAAGEWDLILMDIGLPGIDGIEATRRIRQITDCSGRRIPLVLFTAMSGASVWVDGLRAGADDIVPKAIDQSLLKAKLRGLLSASAQARLLAERSRQLRAYHDAAEREKDFGRHVLTALTRRGQLADPALFVWQREVDGLSGDLVAHRRVGDAHYLLLADAMGHGMSAALVTILVADMFYAMAAKALPLPDIAVELNRKLVRTLPPGNFVGATLVRAQSGRLDVINAGMPACLLLRGAAVVAEFASRNLPFGIEIGESGPVAEAVAAQPGDRLVLLSDGVLEGPLALDTLVAAVADGSVGAALDTVDAFRDDATCAALDL